MGMLWTTVGFAGLAGMLVTLQMRRGSARADKAAGDPDHAPCPRCGAGVPGGRSFCPGCGVPLQAFEMVNAPVVEDVVDLPSGGPLHALVRADLCVGCGTCVEACPEPGAIRLVDKVATVQREACRGHGSCVAACPIGAIVLSSGRAVQRVEVPMVNVHFESNVPGLYIVGELGGRGLIKNAINEGKIAVEHIARVLPPGGLRADLDTGAYDVVIVGSGPAGLSAGLEAHRAGLRYVVLEQGSLSDTIRKYPRKKLLLAEPTRTPLYGDLWVADASKETLLGIWQNLIAETRLDVRTGQRVDRIERDGPFFLLATGDREYRARRVVLAIGRRGTPRRLGVPGEDLDKVFYDIVEMEAFAGSRMLVVGGGDSAVESALGLANQPGTEVALSYRGTDFARAKDRNRAKLEAAVAAGRVRLLLGSEVKEIRQDAVVLDHQGRTPVEPTDAVVIRIGGEAPYPILERIGVRIVRKEIALEPTAAAGAG